MLREFIGYRSTKASRRTVTALESLVLRRAVHWTKFKI
jgi:hypothetical protein